MTIIRCYRYWKPRRNTESKKLLWIENYSFKGMYILYYQNWDFNKLTYMATTTKKCHEQRERERS